MLAQNYQLDQTGHLVIATIDTTQLTGSESQELTQDLLDRMRNDGARHFILDMRHVEFMDSACIGSLVEFLQDIEHVRGRIALAGCSKNVEFLFKVTRLDNLFRMFDDVEDAEVEVANGTDY